MRIGLVVLLIVWTFYIVRPFLMPLLWAVIIAVSLYPVYTRIESALGGRRALAAVLTTVLALAVLFAPSVYLGGTLVKTVEHLTTQADEGGIRIPPPPDGVGSLPVIGPTVERYWTEAASDSGAVRKRLAPHLKPLAGWLVSAAAGMTLTFATFVVAILVAGVLMAYTPQILSPMRRVVLRVAPREGAGLARLAEDTIRNVSRGVVGVAFIQALCAGVGFLLVGIPAAGLLALLCLVLAVIQLGVLPVVGPIAIYAFFKMDLIVAIPFALWCGFVGLIDNILKPLLLHHGLSTPLWVIVVGSIGGLVSAGITGLFVGPVLLVLAYELGGAWLAADGPGEARDDAGARGPQADP